MKKVLMMSLLMISTMVFAQEKVAPKFEAEGEMVKATYFYADGTVAQTGYYLDGKVHGEWISYDQQGNKSAMGQYELGEKVGKWFFWTAEELNEVTYQNSRIAQVTRWTNSESVVKVQ